MRILTSLISYIALLCSFCESQLTTVCDNNTDVTLQANGSTGYITSYNYPGDYYGNVGQCRITIETNKSYIKLNVEDYLRRNGGVPLIIFEDNGQILTSETAEVNKSYSSKSRKIYVTHLTSGSINDAFKISYQGRAGECKSVGCNSHGSKYKRCKVFSSRDVVFVQVKKKKSKKKACKLGRSYGKVAGDIWVNLGCQATFKVCDVADPGKSSNTGEGESQYWIAVPVVVAIVAMWLLLFMRHRAVTNGRPSHQNTQPTPPASDPAPPTTQNTSTTDTGTANLTPEQDTGSTIAPATEPRPVQDSDRTDITNRNEPPPYEEAIQFPQPDKSSIVYMEVQPVALPQPPPYSHVIDAINTGGIMDNLQTTVPGVHTTRTDPYALSINPDTMTPVSNHSSHISDETLSSSGISERGVPDNVNNVSTDKDLEPVVLLFDNPDGQTTDSDEMHQTSNLGDETTDSDEMHQTSNLGDETTDSDDIHQTSNLGGESTDSDDIHQTSSSRTNFV